MRAKLFAGLVATFALAGLSAPAAAQAKPTRVAVAVMDFDYGTLDHWWGTYDIGKGMADQVVDGLVNDGTFRVIERKKLDTVLAEQDFSKSDRADPSAAKLSKLGKVLGVKYIIAGSITRFSTEKRGAGVRVKGVGLGGGKAKSIVSLTARMIDTTTGEIVLSAKGEGDSNKGGDVNFSTGGVAAGTNAEEWRNSGLGEAQEKACTALVAAFVARKDRVQ